MAIADVFVDSKEEFRIFSNLAHTVDIVDKSNPGQEALEVIVQGHCRHCVHEPS